MPDDPTALVQSNPLQFIDNRSKVEKVFNAMGLHSRKTLIAVRDETADFVADVMQHRHEGVVGQMQASIGISRRLNLALNRDDIILDDLDVGIRKNPYNTLEKQIDSLKLKYLSMDDFGNILTQRCVLLRAAFTMGGGVNAVIKKTPRQVDDGTDNQIEDAEIIEDTGDELAEGEVVQGQDELDFILEFLEFNSLEGYRSDTLAIQRELEGSVLLVLHSVFDGGEFVNIAIEIISWQLTRYQVFYKTLDGRENVTAGIDRVEWMDAKGQMVRIPGERVVFLPFGALPDAKDGVPTLAPVIRDLEEHDINERQFDRSNKYNANPTTVNKWEDAEQALQMHEKFEKGTASFKWGQVVNTTAEVTKLELEGVAHEAFEINIKNKVRNISAATGIPPLLLGYPDLMSNRSTADFAADPMSVISEQERKVWVDGLKALFDKAIRLRAEAETLGAVKLEEGLIDPIIPFITARDLKIVKEIFMPMAEKGLLPVQALLEVVSIARFRGDELLEMLEKERTSNRPSPIQLIGPDSLGVAAIADTQADARDPNIDFVNDNAPQV